MFLSKPFIPDMFPGYEGYVWIDADVWFQDENAIQDYIEAARMTGASFAFESHPSYQGTQKNKKMEVFGKVIIKGSKNYFLSKSLKMFGARLASECVGARGTQFRCILYHLWISGLAGMAGSHFGRKN